MSDNDDTRGLQDDAAGPDEQPTEPEAPPPAEPEQTDATGAMPPYELPAVARASSWSGWQPEPDAAQDVRSDSPGHEQRERQWMWSVVLLLVLLVASLSAVAVLWAQRQQAIGALTDAIEGLPYKVGEPQAVAAMREQLTIIADDARAGRFSLVRERLGQLSPMGAMAGPRFPGVPQVAPDGPPAPEITPQMDAFFRAHPELGQRFMQYAEASRQARDAGVEVQPMRDIRDRIMQAAGAGDEQAVTQGLQQWGQMLQQAGVPAAPPDAQRAQMGERMQRFREMIRQAQARGMDIGPVAETMREFDAAMQAGDMQRAEQLMEQAMTAMRPGGAQSPRAGPARPRNGQGGARPSWPGMGGTPPGPGMGPGPMPPGPGGPMAGPMPPGGMVGPRAGAMPPGGPPTGPRAAAPGVRPGMPPGGPSMPPGMGPGMPPGGPGMPPGMGPGVPPGGQGMAPPAPQGQPMALLQRMLGGFMQLLQAEETDLAEIEDILDRAELALLEYNPDQVREILSEADGGLRRILARREQFVAMMRQMMAQAPGLMQQPGPMPGIAIDPQAGGPLERLTSVLEYSRGLPAEEFEAHKYEIARMLATALVPRLPASEPDGAGDMKHDEQAERVLRAKLELAAEPYRKLREQGRDTAEVDALLTRARTALYEKDYPAAEKAVDAALVKLGVVDEPQVANGRR